MKVVSEPLPGIKVLEPFMSKDHRGEFVKPFHEKQLQAVGIEFTLKEEFFSVSSKGVIRGMHFQAPPAAHSKLIYCIQGSVEDVVLDIRKGSPTYGNLTSVELSETNRNIIYIPQGFAHGFKSTSERSILIYKTDFVHSPQYDLGVLWNSFEFEWGEEDPILSTRDQGHPAFQDFVTPF